MHFKFVLVVPDSVTNKNFKDMNHLFRTPLEKKFETQMQLIEDAVENAVENAITFEKGAASRFIASNLSEVALELVRLYQIAYTLPTIVTEVREPIFNPIIDDTLTLTYHFVYIGDCEYLEYMPKENPVAFGLSMEIRYTEDSIEIDAQPQGTEPSPGIMMNIDNGVRHDIRKIRTILNQTAQEIDSFNYSIKDLVYEKLEEKVEKKLKARNKS